MTAALFVLLWVGLVLLILLAVAYAMRSPPTPPTPPERDSALPTTVPASTPGAHEWAHGQALQPTYETRPGWVNTIPTGPVPLDERNPL